MKRMTLPKYTYDKHIIMAPNIANFSKYGIDFVIPVAESEVVSACDSQKEKGKGIFGYGYFISDRLCELREKAEREEESKKEESKKEVEVWELSDRERAIIQKLNNASICKTE
jgi:hypothetical protein